MLLKLTKTSWLTLVNQVNQLTMVLAGNVYENITAKIFCQESYYSVTLLIPYE